jgi:hypothetical protein
MVYLRGFYKRKEKIRFFKQYQKVKRISLQNKEIRINLLQCILNDYKKYRIHLQVILLLLVINLQG